MSFEQMLGRGVALCLNPRAAWRVLPKSKRALVVVAYACVSYVACLTALMLW
jgi:hypothetical protein